MRALAAYLANATAEFDMELPVLFNRSFPFTPQTYDASKPSAVLNSIARRSGNIQQITQWNGDRRRKEPD
jgi:hypothetical protein